MKQRLGIAQALLKDPQILILDEPTSALEPQGRKEVLNLISSLKGEKTIFFSTHILSDVERICDRIGILKDGKLILNDTIDNLKKKFSRRIISIEVDKRQILYEKLKEKSWIEKISFNNKNTLTLQVKDMEIAQKEIIKMIYEEDLTLFHFEFLEPSIEDIFFEVTS